MQKSYFAVIPATVRYCKEIPDGAKLLYGEITALSNEAGYCWATNSYFAELYNTSERTVSRWISDLARAGFIFTLVDSEAGNARKIWLSESQGGIDKNVHRVTTKTSKGYRQKCREGIDKNVYQNNTMNNTLNNSLSLAREIEIKNPAKAEHSPIHSGAGPTVAVELHDPALPGVKIVEGVAGPLDIPQIRINLADRPNAETPTELEAALRKFYTEYPNEWKIGVLENGRGAKHSDEKRREIVKDFCCWAVENGRGLDTYRQLNARLQGWFRNEQYAGWKQESNNKAAVYERPKNAVY